MNSDHKIHARIRREKALEAMKDGHDYTTRVIPSGFIYKRRLKHMPQTPLDWDEVD